MPIATTSQRASRSLLQHAPVLAFSLAGTAVVLLALAPLGWRAGLWPFRFSLLTLLPWAAYFGVAALVVSAVTIVLGPSRIGWRGIAIAAAAFAIGALIAYVPWHYDQLRRTVPPIHDITTDTEHPPAFSAAIAALRTEKHDNPAVYEGSKIAEQQRQAYPDIAPLIVPLAPDAAFNRALDAARQMGWTIVAADDKSGQIEATDQSRWMGFTDDIVIRVAKTDAGSRIDLRSSSRLGRSDFGVNAARVRAFLARLHAGGVG
jgi:uncharacterized protein (DUF1499 family)